VAGGGSSPWRGGGHGNALLGLSRGRKRRAKGGERRKKKRTRVRERSWQLG